MKSRFKNGKMATFLLNRGNASSLMTSKQKTLFGAFVDTSASEGHRDSRNQLNNLTGKEWIQETTTVWHQKGLGINSKEAKYEKMHPAPFSFTDIVRVIKFFTKRGGTVLDPFCGIGSTLKACVKTSRVGTGIELSPEWCRLAAERLDKEVGGMNGQTIINDDASHALDALPIESFDLVVTSPPYFNILRKKADHKTKPREESNLPLYYSDDPRDLGNIKLYDDFLDVLVDIIDKCHVTLRPRGHAVIIASDFRDGSNFIPFHADLLRSVLDRTKFCLLGITILVQSSKRLLPYGYPFAYVPNVHHQYILIFKKGVDGT